MAVGAYPGTFDPLTVAHLAVAEAARRHFGLERVDLVVSTTPLGKGRALRPCLHHRVEVLRRAAATRTGLDVVVTDAQLLADIAHGYDMLVVGADKWQQVIDPAFYGDSATARDAALARLPRVVVVPRSPHRAPAGLDVLLLDADLDAVSSTGARAGRRDWMATEARALDDLTGAWSAPERYDAWCAADLARVIRAPTTDR